MPMASQAQRRRYTPVDGSDEDLYSPQSIEVMEKYVPVEPHKAPVESLLESKAPWTESTDAFVPVETHKSEFPTRLSSVGSERLPSNQLAKSAPFPPSAEAPLPEPEIGEFHQSAEVPSRISEMASMFGGVLPVRSTDLPQAFKETIERPRVSTTFRPRGASAPATITDTPSPKQSRSGMRILVSLPERRVYLLDAKGDAVASYKALVGEPGNRTPRGTFNILEKSVPGAKEKFLGRSWLGFSRKGQSYYGIHGKTSEHDPENTLGCVALEDQDASDLYSRISLGDPVEISEYPFRPPARRPYIALPGGGGGF